MVVEVENIETYKIYIFKVLRQELGEGLREEQLSDPLS
jgi:hypothetical protein